MLSNITWWQFIATILILLLLYYPIILWLFFKKEIYQLFQKQTMVNDQSSDKEAEGHFTEEVSLSESEVPLYSASEAGMVADLMQDISTAVTQTKEDDGTKDELLSLIRVLLQRYPTLKDSNQRAPINEFITEECKRFPLQLSMFQAIALWTKGETPVK